MLAAIMPWQEQEYLAEAAAFATPRLDAPAGWLAAGASYSAAAELPSPCSAAALGCRRLLPGCLLVILADHQVSAQTPAQ